MNWGMDMADYERELDDLFAQARQTRDTLPEGLAVRIETDAEAVRLSRLPRPAPATWRQRIAGIGGWTGLGGLVAASVAGVWVGFAAPSFLPDPAEYLVSHESSVFLADLSFDVTYLEETE